MSVHVYLESCILAVSARSKLSEKQPLQEVCRSFCHQISAKTAVCTGLLVVDITPRWLFNFAAYRAVTPSFVTYCDCRLPESSAVCKTDA